MGSAEIIMFGLFLDAIGAVLIVFPFLNMYIVRRDRVTGKEEAIQRDAPVRRVQWYAWWGVGFLVVGFLFQAYGVWLQSQEISSILNGS